MGALRRSFFPFLALLLLSVPYAAYEVLGELQQQYTRLPVLGATVKTASQGQVADVPLAMLYPLVVQGGTGGKRQSGDGSDIDAAFVHASPAPIIDEVRMPALHEMDYFGLLPKAMSLDAILGNGAIINGKFYAAGALIEEFAFPAKNGKGMVTPKLHVLSDREVEITANGRSLKLRAGS